ncbi:inositol monophosphatase family protein [Natrialbaceae archaeon GCM10025810]|uniref:inositol monophosphatase family protein n=1 Tax=Halovalidus salilacus TaxID=3075124 RepID=UPI00361FA63A
MNERDVRRRGDLASRAAAAGAEVAIDSFRSALEVETKGAKTDVVTQADRDAQRTVAEVIGEVHPDEPIVGEEDGVRREVPEEGPAWVVDPIDGTSNFVRGIPTFGTAVAAVLDGEPIAGTTVFPALSDTYRFDSDGAFLNDDPISVSGRDDPDACAVCPTMWWSAAERDAYAAATKAIVDRFGDMRRYGCAQYELALVAAGGLEGALTDIVSHPWDTLVGVGTIRAAGGTVTDLEGERWRHDSRGLVASNGEMHEAVLEAAREIVE